MLIRKPRNELKPSDIREFCRQFDEGIRVEYKSDLTASVRRDIPAVVSSLANSYGGVLLIGVQTRHGRAVEPIEGFTKPAREELVLTVENLCSSNIYPMLLPQTTEISSDVVGKAFLLVEVEPSPEAPHAIENSRKVYVRTGSANKSYDLADLDLVERLMKRRERVLQVRTEFEADAEKLLQKFGNQTTYPKVRVLIGPRYPHSRIADRECIFQFLRDTRFRGGHFYRVDALRRMPRGACGTRENMFGYLDVTGHLLHQEVPECTAEGNRSYYLMSELILPVLQASYCATKFYDAVGHASDVFIEAKAFDLLGHACIDRRDYTIEQFEPNIDAITAEMHASSEQLWQDALEVATALVHQLVWPMKQGHESVAEGQIRRVVERVLAEYKP